MAVGGKDLVDLVFSWSINDVMNTELYKDQVFIFYVFAYSSYQPLVKKYSSDLRLAYIANVKECNFS